MDEKTLSCPNCGSPVVVRPMDRALKCDHCGSDLRHTSQGELLPFFNAPPERGTGPGGVDVHEVERLLRNGKKIDAIKLVRGHTGWGLKETKDYVDDLAAGLPRRLPAARDPARHPGGADRVDWQRIRNLLAKGQKIEAIKQYRRDAGVDLKAAKEAIEALPEAKVPSASRDGCSRIFLAGLLFILLIFGGYVSRAHKSSYLNTLLQAGFAKKPEAM